MTTWPSQTRLWPHPAAARYTDWVPAVTGAIPYFPRLEPIDVPFSWNGGRVRPRPGAGARGARPRPPAPRRRGRRSGLGSRGLPERLVLGPARLPRRRGPARPLPAGARAGPDAARARDRAGAQGTRLGAGRGGRHADLDPGRTVQRGWARHGARLAPRGHGGLPGSGRR